MSEITSSTSTQTSSDAVSTAPTETPGTEQTVANTPPSLKEKFKLKVDGEDIEDELDWNDKEGIKQRLQLAAAAKKRMNEASEAKRKAFDIVKQFESDPESMLKRLGPKGREIAEKYLLAQIQEDMLTDDEKKDRTDKSELEMLRREKLEREENEKTAKEKAAEHELAQNFQQTIISALEKSGLPKTPDLVKRMAGIMKKNLDYGLDLTPDELVQEVKKETGSTLKAIIKDMDGDQLIQFFGEETAKKIRMSDVKKIKDKNSMLFGSQDKVNQKSDIPVNDKKPMSMDEWKEELNRRVNGK